jgi:hypothetical protein
MHTAAAAMAVRRYRMPVPLLLGWIVLMLDLKSRPRRAGSDHDPGEEDT